MSGQRRCHVAVIDCRSPGLPLIAPRTPTPAREIVAGHLPEHRKVRNIRNDSRVALSIETDERNAMGLNEYLVIYGTARITEGGAAELLQRLARTYLGPDVRFPPMDSPPPGYITHIRVDRVSGVGPWAAQR
jgi:hypothetical protein